jgi:hypothetical protein
MDLRDALKKLGRQLNDNALVQDEDNYRNAQDEQVLIDAEDKYRNTRDEQLLIDAGFIRHGDGTWHPPSEEYDITDD